MTRPKPHALTVAEIQELIRLRVEHNVPWEVLAEDEGMSVKRIRHIVGSYGDSAEAAAGPLTPETAARSARAKASHAPKPAPGACTRSAVERLIHASGRAMTAKEIADALDTTASKTSAALIGLLRQHRVQTPDAAEVPRRYTCAVLVERTQGPTSEERNAAALRLARRKCGVNAEQLAKAEGLVLSSARNVLSRLSAAGLLERRRDAGRTRATYYATQEAP